MSSVQLQIWRDIAIEYLPAAQEFREQAKNYPVDDDRNHMRFAEGLWRVADETIARYGAHSAPPIERAAACVLLGIAIYELYDPSSEALATISKARGIDPDPEKRRAAMLQGIANAVKTLANVTGRDIPMDDPAVYFVEPAMPAIEQIEIQLDDVVRISEAATLMGCTVESLLRQAANDERLLYVALKPHSQKLSAVPSHPNPRTGSRTTKEIIFVAMLSRDAVSLATIGSADISQYQASFGGTLDWHYWMLDVPQTIGIDRVFVPRSQLPDAPAAKVEANGVTNNSIPTNNWILKIQAEAARRWSELVAMGCSPTRNSIKDDLAKWCKDNEVRTDGGIFPTGEYIYRHVIRAAIWKSPTD